MSDIPQPPVSRRGRKPLVSLVSLLLVTGLVSALPASALAYNTRPDVDLGESVDGHVAEPAAIPNDTTMSDAAVEALAEAEWPEPGLLGFDEGETAPQALTAGDETVWVGGVDAEEFESWVSPLPKVVEDREEDEAEGANERRTPAEPLPEGSDDADSHPEEEAEEPVSAGPEASDPDTELDTDAEPDPETEPAPELEEQQEVEEPEGPVTSAQVEVLDRAEVAELGLSGLALRVTRTDGGDDAGPVRVEVDYSGFSSAFGADYGSRLDLVALTECDDDEGCWTTHELGADNDTDVRTLHALVPATGSGILVAAVAAADSEEGTGDYTATSLSPSSTWNVGTQSGGFSWNYPVQAPNVAGGLQPEISLGYSSQSVDGRTSGTNNQTSWIGEGFDYHPGYIERRYQTCQDDDTDIPDQCWSHHNATLNLGGRSTELVYDDGEWTPKNDDGSKIERLTGATNADNDGEHWRVTTVDGTQYHFGLNRLPGHSSGDEETNSAWTVPVFGNDAGEPCHKSNLGDAWCDQAWRWNLDYVVDLQGNALAHYYQAETNNYGLNFKSDPVKYDRGGYLKRTAYGLHKDDLQATAPAQVLYGVGERCVDTDFGCKVADRKESNAKYWPDTPLDQECDKDCAGKHSPTFWTTKKLNKITTQLHDGTEYTTVDSWEFKHSFPAPGDGTDPALWLDSITHTGHTGEGTETKPAITFTGTPMPNRVDSTTDGLAPMNKWRITAIHTETGAQVDVSYADSDCEAGKEPKAHENTKRCFPVVRTHRPGADDITDWFAKYVVTDLVEVDLVGGQPDVITSYDYVGTPAWAYMDDDGFVDKDHRTWSQWRGFDRVIERTGHPDETRTEVEHLYYQGMNGDHLPSGKRTVRVTDSTGTSVDDDPVFNGQLRESIVRNGVGGEVVSKTISTPWKKRTASTSHSWTLEAHLTNTKQVDAYTALEDGSFRQTRTVNTFDDHGMIASVHDQGDVAVTDDDWCTTTTYARNTGLHLLDPVARTQTVTAACGQDVSYPDDVVSDTRTLHDGGAFGDAPTKARPTETQRVADYEDGEPVYQTITETTFDTFGRALEVTDAKGNTTTTAYTSKVAGGPDSKVETTNTLGHKSTVEYDERSQPIAEIDANGNRTELAYDPLGRMTDVWLADRPRDRNFTPSMRFEYDLSKDKPTVVTTHTLNPAGRYTTSYQILDGMLRERQSQAPAPGGGRVLTDVFHDSRGNTVISREPYFNTEEPDGELLTVNNHDEIPRWTHTVYDGADRATDAVHMSRGVEQFRTTTEHQGDRTLVTEPEGGTGTTAITDARGNTVELRKHHGPAAEGEFDSTFYTYTARSELRTVTDPGDNTWTYEYDLRGRKVTETDPDTGVSQMVYDELDRLVETTDARGQSLKTVYDELGRQIELRDGGGDLRAEWTFDSVAVGLPATSTRYEDGQAFTTRVMGYDRVNRPRAHQINIPASEGELAGNYLFRTFYNPDGSVRSTDMPAAGALRAEPVTYGYDNLGNPTTLSGGDRIVTETVYSKVGNLVQRELHRGVLGASRTWQSFDFDEKTNRLALASVVPQQGQGSLSTQTYGYDARGNLLSINDEPTDPDRASDVQCFDYDHLRRLNQVWTPDAVGKEACDAEPEVTELGGTAPYWHEFTYDAIGNRVQEVQHGPGGGVTRDYTSPEDGQGPAHAVTQVDESGSGGSTAHFYDYDEAGNMVSRKSGEHDQTLEWGPEGELTKVTGDLSETEYVYDADGERLLRRANGVTTLYLPGMEVTWDPAEGTEEATRYFTHAGETVAVRENSGRLHWIVSDHHDTGQMSIDANSNEVAQRRMTVFGQDRGTTGSWPGERGFVDGMIDASTGLTQLGARAYEADLGRFISVDPLMDLADGQQMHGYAYANNSPMSFTDPDGLLLVGSPGRKQAPAQPSWHHDKWLWNQQYVHQNNPKALKRATQKFHRITGGSYRPTFSGARPHKPSPTPRNPFTGASATVDPQTQAKNDASWMNETRSAVGGWVSSRYTTDDGLNWWNIAGDAAFAMSFIPGLQWVGFALGAGVGISKLFSSGQKNVDGIWDIAGALPFGIGKGSRFLARSSIRSNAADFFSYKSSKRKPNSQAVRSRYNSLRGDISSSRYYDSVVQGTAGMIGGAHDFVTGARAVEDPGWSWAA
ncbi:RHS repeat-associated core domain-containing protein [Nocardiopsis prasina]|uniref:RHS repeat-associated core domain-containing protein n=1 Tax=Nocardiopsis prasina TaxID=2015 RepID=UPI00034DC68D|nr:RHS repeat-associated core domain-containing protein [Nocardiopsis prasina]